MAEALLPTDIYIFHGLLIRYSIRFGVKNLCPLFYAITDYDFPPRYIVLWGKYIDTSLFHAHEQLLQARRQGIHLIVIDARRTALATPTTKYCVTYCGASVTGMPSEILNKPVSISS